MKKISPIRIAAAIATISCLCSTASMLAAPRTSSDYSLTTESFAPGGSMTSGSYQLNGGNMEPISDSASSAAYQLQHGFLVTGGATTRVTLPGNQAPPVGESNENWAGNEQEADGSYAGILTDANGSAVAAINLKLSSKNGGVSGSIIYDGLTLKFKGVIQPDGSLTLTIVHNKTGRSFDLALQLVTTPEGFRVAGTVNEGTSTLGVQLDQSAFTRNDPAPFLGTYTALIPASPRQTNAATHPQGDGWGTMSIATNGKIRFAGQLGDGTKLTLTGVVSKDGTWRVFKSLYRTKPEGTFAGTVTFRDIPNVSDFDGEMHWLKNADSRERIYPAGFEIDVRLIGSHYQRPFPNERVLSQLSGNDDNATWMLGMGDLPVDPDPQSITWDERNRINHAAVGSEKLSIRISNNNGRVIGAYRDKTVALRVKFAGVAFQKQGLVAGTFIGVAQSGYLTIQPAGGPALQIRSFAGDIRIQADDASPDVADGTDFGDTGIDGGFADRSFRVRNSGNANLFILGYPNVVGSSSFSVISARTGPLTPGEEMLITVRFDPSALGSLNATITIFTNDVHDNPFSFAVTGNGIAGDTSSHDGALGGWTGVEPPVPAAPPATTSVAFADAQIASYFGLLTSPVVGQGNPGVLAVKVGKNGAFSGTLQLDGSKYKFKDALGAGGNATVQIVTKTGDVIDVALQTHQANGSGQFRIQGTVVDGASTYGLDLVRNDFHRITNPAPQSGSYTMIVIGNDDLGNGLPGGDGAVTVLVRTNGTVIGRAVLGDQTKLTLAGSLSADGEWPLYRTAYLTKPAGSLSGMLTFRDLAGVSDFDGVLAWQKHSSSREKIYAHGFKQRIKAIGALYTAPAKTERALASLSGGSDNAQLTLDGGNLDPALPSLPFTWDIGDKTSYTPSALERLTVKISSKSGAVTASYGDRSNGTRITRINAVIFQKQDLVSGSFLGDDATGRLLIEAD